MTISIYPPIKHSFIFNLGILNYALQLRVISEKRRYISFGQKKKLGQQRSKFPSSEQEIAWAKIRNDIISREVRTNSWFDLQQTVFYKRAQLS